MAIDYDSATPDYLSIGSALASMPMTFACWFNQDSAANQTLISMSDSTAASHYFDLLALSTGVIRFRANAGGAAVNANTSTTYTAGQWGHACGVATSATDRAVFLNGGGKGTNATSRSPTTNTTAFAALITSGGASQPFNGLMCDVAIWNVALSDADVAALYASGPLMVRPASLVTYLPMIRGRTIALVGGQTYTVSGNPQPGTSHAPVKRRIRPYVPEQPHQIGSAPIILAPYYRRLAGA